MEIPHVKYNKPSTDERLAKAATDCFRLVQTIRRCNELKTKTNKELAEMLTNQVWAEYRVFSSEADLVGEVVDRLNKEY